MPGPHPLGKDRLLVFDARLVFMNGRQTERHRLNLGIGCFPK